MRYFCERIQKVINEKEKMVKRQKLEARCCKRSSAVKKAKESKK